MFTLELYLQTRRGRKADDKDGLVLLRNVTSALPSFAVDRLEPASILEAMVYASNREGRSQAATVKASTLKRPAEKRLRLPGDDHGEGGKHGPNELLTQIGQEETCSSGLNLSPPSMGATIWACRSGDRERNRQVDSGCTHAHSL